MFALFNSNEEAFMSAITEVQICACYEVAGRVLRNGEPKPKLADYVSRSTGMDAGSARIYIDAVVSLVQRGTLGRDISTFARRSFLGWIARDYGADALARALCAYRKRDEWLKLHGYTYGTYTKIADEYSQS